MTKRSWTVPADIVRIVDGDTLIADLDLGWGVIRKNARIRLAGVNAPEMSTPQGKPALQWVTDQLRLGSGEFRPVTLVSHTLDKYGRVLGDIYWWPADSGVIPPVAGQHHLNADLLAAGHAVVMNE